MQGVIAMSYSPEEESYSLYRIHPCPDGPQFLKMEESGEFAQSTKYLNHLYKVGSTIIENSSKEIVLEFVEQISTKQDFLPST